MLAPLYLMHSLPPELTAAAAGAGFSIDGYLTALIVAGVVGVVLAVVDGATDQGSAANLAASVLSKGVWFYVSLLTMGVGDPLSMGLRSFSAASGGASVTLTVDLRVFVALAAATLGLQLCRAVATYLEAGQAS